MTAVEWLVDKLQKSKDWHRILNEVSQMSTAKIDLINQAKEMEKEQKIEFAKLHVQTALKAVENEMILQASSVKHWYLPETIK